MSENKVRILVDNFYKDFAGLPNHRAIVRNNTPEDAFTLAILKIMYGEMHIPQELHIRSRGTERHSASN